MEPAGVLARVKTSQEQILNTVQFTATAPACGAECRDSWRSLFPTARQATTSEMMQSAVPPSMKLMTTMSQSGR
jgi:hypothetical protein